MARLRPVRLLLKGVDQASGPIRRVNDRIERMRAPVKRLQRDLRGLSRNLGLQRLGRAARGVGTELAALTRRAGLLGTALGAAAVAGMGRFISRTDELAKRARQFQITGAAIQELTFAAERSGVSAELLDQSLGAFSKRLGEARAGSGRLKTILERTNPELFRQLTTTDSLDEAFTLLLDEMASMENAQDRNALAAAAFSRAGQDIVRMAGGVRGLREEFRELGFTLDDETLAASEETADRLTDLGTMVKGTALVIGAELLPTVRRLTTQLSEWLKRMLPVIRLRAAEWAERFAEGLKSLVRFLSDAIPRVLAFVDAIGGWRTVLGIVAFLISAKLIVALFSLGAALTNTVMIVGRLLIPVIFKLGAALLATPVGWFLAAVAAIAGIAYLVVKHWDPIKAWFADLWESITDTVGGAIDAITERVKGLVKPIRSALGQVRGMLPGFVRDRIFGGEEEGAGSRTGAAVAKGLAGAAASAVGLGPVASTVGGLLRIQIESEQPTRVTEQQGEGGLDLETEQRSGPIMATP